MRTMLLSLLLFISATAVANGHLPGEKGSHPTLAAWLDDRRMEWPNRPRHRAGGELEHCHGRHNCFTGHITSPEGTAMVEIVHIEEVENTLELHIQQWDSGFKPRSPAQKMRLVNWANNLWPLRSPGGLKKLGYAMVGEEFHVRIKTADDQEMVIKLAAKP